jgi:hypothetical protein
MENQGSEEDDTGVVVDGFPRTALQVGPGGRRADGAHGARLARAASAGTSASACTAGAGRRQVAGGPGAARGRLCAGASQRAPAAPRTIHCLEPHRPAAHQVDFLKLFHDKLQELHDRFLDTPDSRRFPRPAFKVGRAPQLPRYAARLASLARNPAGAGPSGCWLPCRPGQAPRRCTAVGLTQAAPPPRPPLLTPTCCAAAPPPPCRSWCCTWTRRRACSGSSSAQGWRHCTTSA